MGLTLIGTIPPARMESQELSPPGKLTVTMVREFFNDPDTTIPDCPIGGLFYKGYTIENPMDGGFGKVRWKWEGVDILDGTASGDGGGGGGGGDVDPMKEVAELQISLDQIPLEAHPHIGDIMKKFGGTIKDGELSFPRKDPTDTSQRESVDEKGNTIKLNPFYGVTSYLAPRVVFRLRKIDGASSSTTDRLGKIDSPPWPWSGSGDWLKMVVNTREWGDKFESTEEWLYADNGWSTMIYDFFSEKPAADQEFHSWVVT